MKAFDLKLRGLAAPVLVVGVENPQQLFAEYLQYWPHKIVPHNGSNPFATLVFNGERFLLKTNKYDAPKSYDTSVNAVCDIVAAAARQRADERPEEMCLHAASVRMGKALVVFPAVRRAGKSSLTTALAAKGFEIYGDDVLSVVSTPGSPAVGTASGAPIRLRLPLPDGFPDWMRDYAKTHAGPSNRQYGFLSPPEVAPNGEQAPVGVFVHLEREEGIATEFTPMSRGRMLRSLLKQNFARIAPADRILGDLFSLAENTQAYRLRYSDLQDAVDVLTVRFQTQSAPNYSVPERAILNATKDEEIPMGSDVVLCRNPTATLRELDGEVFALNRQLTRVLHLNAGAIRLWNLLAEATSEAEAIETFQLAFPDIPLRELQADTRKGFQDFKNAGLVTRAGS